MIGHVYKPCFNYYRVQCQPLHLQTLRSKKKDGKQRKQHLTPNITANTLVVDQGGFKNLLEGPFGTNYWNKLFLDFAEQINRTQNQVDRISINLTSEHIYLEKYISTLDQNKIIQAYSGIILIEIRSTEVL